jgi:hypothetical protein
MRNAISVHQVSFPSTSEPFTSFKSFDKPSFISVEHICALGYVNGFVSIHLTSGHVFVVKENMKELRENIQLANN